jgi:hypothetical protein
MKVKGTVPLALAAMLFAICFANVALGAFAQAAFLGEVAAMLTLSASVVAFVVGILGREASEAASRTSDTKKIKQNRE